MKDILDSVSASPRLRRFTTYYMMLYFAVTLAVNLLVRYVPVINDFAGGHVKSFVIFLIEGALMYGLIRGIVTKSYNIGDAVGAFGETENYLFYLAYAVINTAYGVLYSLVSMLSEKSGTLGTIGLILSALFIVVRFLVNFALVRLYFDKILFGAKKLDIAGVCKACADVFVNKPLRLFAAEGMLLLVKYIATLLGSVIVAMTISAFGDHWAISFIATCFVTIQFGALIYVWPVYYLYYKETCEQ